jgi:DHA1 family bicyclomycin/chloramphenicol resistance-like MFS transporter
MPTKSGSFVFTLALGALTALPPLSIDMSLPAIPAIEATFAGAQGRGPLTLSLFLLGFALTPLFCGAVSDRLGRRPTMLAGLALFTLAAAGCSLATTFPALLGFRLVQGIGAGTCVIMPMAIVRDLFSGSESQGKFAQIMAVMGLAPLLAPILGGWVMAVSHWRSIYAVQALVGVLILAWVAFGFEESLPAPLRRSLKPAELVAGYGLVLSNRAFRHFTLVFSLGFACIFAYISGSAAVLMGVLGLKEQAFSLAFALSSSGMLLGSFANARLSKGNVPSNRILGAGLALMGLSATFVLVLALSGHVHPLILSLAVTLVFFGFALIAPCAMHSALEPLPQVAGLASGITNGVQFAMGSGVSALIAGLLPFGHPALVMSSVMVGCALAAAAIFIAQMAWSPAILAAEN